MIQKLINQKLRTLPVFTMLLFFIIACNNNEAETYREVQLNEGLPEPLESLEKDLPFKDFKYANLDTGTDTLQVMFGTFMQDSIKGNWMAIASKGIPAHFSTLSLEEVDSLDYRTKDIHLEFNEDRNRVSVRVIEVDSLTFKYIWLDNSESSKDMVLETIEKPLRANSQFPEMNLDLLDGGQVSSSEFKDQFVVINWWATWCRPCIEEIPGLNKIVEKYKLNDNIRFIAITDDPESRITSFLMKKDFNYEMTFANQEVQTLFGQSYPVNIIIDPTGKITYIKKGAGPHTPAEIDSSLSQQIESYYANPIVQVD